MNKKDTITFDWLKRYTGTNPKDYGDWILLTNFQKNLILKSMGLVGQ